MATVYRTKQGDVLDAICHAHYQDSNAMIKVLEANPFLCEKGAVLESNILITLPELSTSTGTAQTVINLWD